MLTRALAGDEILLTVPAEAGFARVARVCGGALAARLGFPYDDVESVRLAVGEAWTILVGDEQPDASVEVRFRVLVDGLAVDLTLRGGSDHGRRRSDEPPLAAAAVLARIVDEHAVAGDGRSVHLEKHVSPLQRSG